MEPATKHNIQTIAQHFQIAGTFISAEPFGSGHINDTYAATYQSADGPRRYIHQRINHSIFKNPIGMMDNIQRVITHLHRKLSQQPEIDLSRQSLTLIPTHQGVVYHQDEGGDVWRTYTLIEGAKTYDVVDSPEQAYAAGRAFGEFQHLLVDFPGPRLVETIPDFHHTPKRFATLQAAIEADVVNRAATAKAEIDFALSQESMTGVLLARQAAGEIPERVTHNDTKINNVLLDEATGQGLCVVDLDTVMPGLVLYDFGDMVRTATCLAAEDEPDLSKVQLEMPLFEALTRGYLETAGAFLTPTEKAYLTFSGKLITFTIGIRFLTDYLAGDTYFKTHRPHHNLDRCRTQFKLIQSMMAQEGAMQRLVEGLAAAAD